MHLSFGRRGDTSLEALENYIAHMKVQKMSLFGKLSSIFIKALKNVHAFLTNNPNSKK